MICRDVQQLRTDLSAVIDELRAGTAAPRRRHTYYGDRDPAANGGVGFLFPGEGSQYQEMLSDLSVALPPVRSWFDLLDEVFGDSGDASPSRVIFPPPTCLTESERLALSKRLFAFDMGSAAVFVASMAVHGLLTSCGVRAQAMAGHSTGEGAALIAAGVIRHRDRGEFVDSMRRFYETCRDLDSSGRISKGRMISVGAIDDATLRQVLEGTNGRAMVALDNCPNQKVVFCEADAAQDLLASLQRAGGICATMDLDRAYHTPHFMRLSDTLRALYDGMDVSADGAPIFSCVTAEPFPRDREEIRTLATRQWFSEVRFRETVEKMHAHGIRTFIEVGPGGTLTSFVRDTLRSRDHVALACAPQAQPGLTQFQRVLAQLFVRSVDVDLAPLFTYRDVPLRDLAAGTSQVEPRRRGSRIDLTMPRMRAESRITELVRSRESEPRATAAVESHPVVASTVIGPAPANDGGSRLDILRGHFQLMNEFLAAQSRVMTGSFQKVGESRAPGAAGDRRTRELESVDPSMWPLLGTIVDRNNGSLRAVRRFDLEHDRWLTDHTLGGASNSDRPSVHALPVVPFTMMMELIAEAARCLIGGDHEVIGLDKVRGHRWLALDDGHAPVVIQANIVPGTGAEPRTVEVSVRQEDEHHASPDGRLIFEGAVLLARRFQPAPPSALEDLQQPTVSHYTEDMLYGAIQDGHERFAPMFHGPCFRVVKTIRGWNQHGIDAIMEVNDKSGFFRGIRTPLFQLDPVLLDAAGQLIGYWVAEQFGTDLTFFPFSIQHYRQYAPVPSAGQRVLCRAVIGLSDEGSSPEAPCFEFLNHAGRVVARSSAVAGTGQERPADFDCCRLTPATAFLEARFEFSDEAGHVFAQIDGWRDRYFSIPHGHYRFHLRPSTAYLSSPWPGERHEFAGRRIDLPSIPYLEEGWQIWKRALAHLVLSVAERACWKAVPGSAATSWLLGRIAAKEAVRDWIRLRCDLELPSVDIEIVDGADGHPAVRLPASIGARVMTGISVGQTAGMVVAIAFDLSRPMDIETSHDALRAVARREAPAPVNVS